MSFASYRPPVQEQKSPNGSGHTRILEDAFQMAPAVNATLV